MRTRLTIVNDQYCVLKRSCPSYIRYNNCIIALITSSDCIDTETVCSMREVLSIFKPTNNTFKSQGRHHIGKVIFLPVGTAEMFGCSRSSLQWSIMRSCPLISVIEGISKSFEIYVIKN